MTNISDRIRATADSLIVHPVQRALRSQKLRTALLAGVVLSTLLAVSILASFIAFIALYRAYIPKVGYSAPLELQYGYGKPPFAQLDNLAGRMPIATNQIYDVFLELVLPPSPGNYALGNFMVDLDLRTVSGDSALRATKSMSQASLVWTPELVRTIRTILRLPFYLFLPSSLSIPKQHVRVPLISRKALRSFSTAQIGSAVLSIGRLDAYPIGLEDKAVEGCPPLATAAVAAAGRPQELQIYDATLRIVAHLTGIRRFMYYHRITSFVIFSTLFFLITLSSAFMLWGGLSLYRHQLLSSASTAPREPRDVSSSITNESKVEPLRAQDADSHDALEEAESVARRKEAQRLSGRRMDLAEHEDAQEEEEESVLRHIKLEPTEGLPADGGGGNGGSRSVIVESAEESSDAESGVLVKAEDGEQGELDSTPVKAEEGDDDADTLLGGSATSVSGETLTSRTSLSGGRTGSVTSSAATSATRSSSLRKRPSTASIAKKLKEDED